MAARMSELEPRVIERLRAELAELIAATVAYPPFFDFRANRLVTRPIDRARMEEIQRFLGRSTSRHSNAPMSHPPRRAVFSNA